MPRFTKESRCSISAANTAASPATADSLAFQIFYFLLLHFLLLFFTSSSDARPAGLVSPRIPHPTCPSSLREPPTAPGRTCAASPLPEFPPAALSATSTQIRSCDGSTAYARTGISETIHRIPPAPPPPRKHLHANIRNRRFSRLSAHVCPGNSP